jgi:two-component system, cell cycle sensor histidine kinase and response regulator CckA
VHPDHKGRANERLAELGRSGQIPTSEARVLRKDGVELTVEAATCRVPLDDGLANVVFFRNVTERKQLESELSRASRLESLGRLAGSVAHDFNNLLGIIQGSLGIARRRLNDPVTLREALDGAEAAAKRAADVTRQLLTFSRGGEARPMLTDPNRVVEEAISLVSGTTKHNVRVEFDPAPQAVHVWMEPSQLHQVVLNLLLNARDAISDRGTVDVRIEQRIQTVRAHPAAKAGQWVVISVADTGSGMDGDTRARIFEPFFTTKAARQGTGLGLATVYGIVRQAGGFIEVHSVPGQGTRFAVYLPIAREA